MRLDSVIQQRHHHSYFIISKSKLFSLNLFKTKKKGSPVCRTYKYLYRFKKKRKKCIGPRRRSNRCWEHYAINRAVDFPPFSSSPFLCYSMATLRHSHFLYINPMQLQWCHFIMLSLSLKLNAIHFNYVIIYTVIKHLNINRISRHHPLLFFFSFLFFFEWQLPLRISPFKIRMGPPAFTFD